MKINKPQKTNLQTRLVAVLRCVAKNLFGWELVGTIIALINGMLLKEQAEAVLEELEMFMTFLRKLKDALQQLREGILQLDNYIKTKSKTGFSKSAILNLLANTLIDMFKDQVETHIVTLTQSINSFIDEYAKKTGQSNALEPVFKCMFSVPQMLTDPLMLDIGVLLEKYVDQLLPGYGSNELDKYKQHYEDFKEDRKTFLEGVADKIQSAISGIEQIEQLTEQMYKLIKEALTMT